MLLNQLWQNWRLIYIAISTEMRRLLNDVAEIDNQLAKGAQRASAIAEPILDEVKEIVGFMK